MRGAVWLGMGAVVLLLAGGGVLGLRGAPAPEPPQAAGTPEAAANPLAGTASPSPSAPAAPAPSSTVTTARPPETPPRFDIVTVDPAGRAVIAGRAAPGAQVSVLEDGKAVGQATADPRGEWVVVPAAPMAPGPRQLHLEATSRTGATTRSEDVVAVSVGAPESKVATVAVLLPGAAEQRAKVLQGNAAAPPGTFSLDTVQFDGNRLIVTGRARPGAQLSVYAYRALLGIGTANARGEWSVAGDHPFGAGPVLVRVDETETDGTVAQRIVKRFEPPTGNPPAEMAAAGANALIVQRGNTLWWIARRAYGSGFRYTAIYSANRDQIRDPDRIYPGQQIKLPKS